MKKGSIARRVVLSVLLVVCVVPTLLAQAQTAGVEVPPKSGFRPHYYHLVFVLKELDAEKIVNSRSYFMSIGTAEGQLNTFNARSIRTGTKVPVAYEPGKISYVDVGVNIDCRNVIERANGVAMDLSAEVSSVQKNPDEQNKVHTIGEGPTPLIQQNKWNSQAIVMLGKPTVIFSSDEVTSKRSIQLEMTATEIE